MIRPFLYFFKIFTGNSDRNTVVKNNFQIPFLARFVRFFVVSVKEKASFRVEIYACPVLSNLEEYLVGKKCLKLDEKR